MEKPVDTGIAGWGVLDPCRGTGGTYGDPLGGKGESKGALSPSWPGKGKRRGA